ncbi:MAG: pleD [Frankiales bacterium]|nr:pleD [Frankiales bacterium]
MSSSEDRPALSNWQRRANRGGDPDFELRLRQLESERYASLQSTDALCAELLEEAERRGETHSAIRVRLVASNVLSRRGHAVAARAQQVRLHEQAEPWPSLARRARMMLAANAARLGERAEATRWIRACLEGWTDGEQPSWRAEALMTSALLSVSRTGVDYTLVRYAITEIRAHCGPQILAVALANFAETAAECGDLDMAAEFADAALALIEEQAEVVTPLILDSIAQARLAMGDLDAAESELRAALELERTTGCADVMGDPWLSLSQVLLTRGRPEEALAMLDHPRRLAVSLRTPWTLTREFRLRASILAELQRWAEAYAALRDHLEVYEIVRSVEGDRAVAEAANLQVVDEERRRARQFEQLALTDSLTGLANRRQVDQWLEEPRRPTAGPLSVAILDLDHFKRINDTYSHGAGDEVLRQIARMLRAFCQEYRDSGQDVLAARLGGEEFLLLWRECQPARAATAAHAVLDRIRHQQFAELEAHVRVTASIGLASGDAEVSGAELLKAADRRLYQAKRSGRDRVVAADTAGVPVAS